MARTDTLPHFLTDIANAIRERGGTVDLIPANKLDEAIRNIPTEDPSPNDSVIFYDYDGTIAHQYTKEKFMALLNMPDRPEHSGVTSKWSMSQVDARTYADSHTYTRIALQTKLSTSNTDRNKVVLNLNVTNNEYLTVFIEFVTIAYAKDKEFRIDWGDGTFDTFITTSASANETVNMSHTYASTGRYAVQLTTVNYAPAALTKPIYGGPDATDEVNQIYKDYLIDYWKGSYTGNDYFTRTTDCWYNPLDFDGYTNLETFMGPMDTCQNSYPNTTWYTYFRRHVSITNCPSLKMLYVPKIQGSSAYSTYGEYKFEGSGAPVVVLANDVVLADEMFKNFSGCDTFYLPEHPTDTDGDATTTIPTSMFLGSNVANISIPDMYTIFEYQCFMNCLNLAKIELPASLTTLRGSCFEGCMALREIDLTKVSQIPDLYNAWTFRVGSIGGNSLIYYNTLPRVRFRVPDAMYDDYIAACNDNDSPWHQVPADRIVRDSDWVDTGPTIAIKYMSSLSYYGILGGDVIGYNSNGQAIYTHHLTWDGEDDDLKEENCWLLVDPDDLEGVVTLRLHVTSMEGGQYSRDDWSDPVTYDPTNLNAWYVLYAR